MLWQKAIVKHTVYPTKRHANRGKTNANDPRGERRNTSTRNIKSVENAAGERFPFTQYLQGAKAMAKHVSMGGTPYDAIGNYPNTCKDIVECNPF